MIYILFDTAINGLYSLMALQKAYKDSISLFEGSKDENLFDVAPYIIKVDEKFLINSNVQYVSMNEIIVVESNNNIDELHEHFQKLIYKKEKGQENFFRFWDARVFKRLFSEKRNKLLEPLFAGIQNYYLLDTDMKIAKKYYRKHRQIAAEECSIYDLFNEPVTDIENSR